MTIEEAIQHHRKVATTFKDKDSEQLADWLTELLEYRAEAQAKPKTNGDRIRQMTDEELAALLLWNVCTVCDGRGFGKCGDDKHCKKHVSIWLLKEADEDARSKTD